MNDEEQLTEFALFLQTNSGFTKESAESYVSYVKGACRRINKTCDNVVGDPNSFKDALASIRRLGIPASTRAHYVRALKVFYEYMRGVAYSEKVEEIPQYEKAEDKMPVEFMKQMNELELRLSDGEASFWQKVFEGSLLVLTIAPTLIAGNGVSLFGRCVLAATMVIGLIGVALLAPILRRSIRQTNELLDYGRKIRKGETCNLEVKTVSKTGLEKWCTRLSMILLLVAYLFVILSIGFAYSSEKPTCQCCAITRGASTNN